MIQRFLAVLIASALCFGQRSGETGYPLPQHGAHGMVASVSSIASAVGLDVLKHGGNAVDAAVAVGLALSVTYPFAGNLGGGGFMMIRMADRRVAAIDYREEAPAKASHDMYVGKDGKLVPRLSTSGYLASGVPGTVAGLSLALSKFGTVSWADAVEPARKLAADGFTVSYALASSLEHSRAVGSFPEGKRIFQRDGKFYQEGETLKQPELAATLERLKTRGPREFYEGQTAQDIAADMRDHGGLITLDDLKDYKAMLREPVKGTYRGYEIISMPPPSSGGIALIEMLNILEHFDLGSMGYNSSEKYHVVVEAMRRAFADRAEFLGDPDFVKVPWSGLISKKYADQLVQTIDAHRATSSAAIGHGDPAPFESTQTTQFTVVDAAGNAVSNTYTLNGGYGSGVVVKGAGFFLNNEMDDFAAKPGVPNMYGLIQGEANSVAPHKRPLSAMTPSFVAKEGKLFFATGSPGGPTIINTVLQVMLNVIDHKMNIQQAVDAPRIHHQWLPDEIRFEPFGMPEDARKALEAMGYHFAERGAYMGDAESILIDPETGLRWGASDPRNPDAAALGY
ncbi:MAG TPA: gamma-glutamyltransferase [Bryobacteraceae bacterium]|nr:gamma-glutamyltransferase [Bryobacteraceae bacterium]